MNERAALWIASTAMVLLLLAGTAILAVIWPPLRQPTWGFTGFSGLLAAAVGLMGGVIVYRRRGNRVGWVLLLVGLMSAIQFVVDLAPLLVIHLGGAGTPAETWASWLSNAIWVPSVSLIGYLLLIYPDGRPPDGRWSALGPLLVVIAILTLVTILATPGDLRNYPGIANPTGLPGLPETLVAVVYPIYMATLCAAALSLVFRWRQAPPVVRAQLKWLALAGIPFVIATSLSVASREAQLVAILCGGLVPVAIAIAILRDRLYEIDRVISRSIGWAIVTGLLVGTFAVLILALQAVLEPLTGGNTLAIATSTLIVAALFNPVRTRVQRAVDRRFDRARLDGERLVEAFAERLRDEVDLTTISADVLATVDAAVRPTRAGLWLRERPGGGA
ncbi:MAG TPA: hypothetical protein VLA23_07970 [Candidatus Limnocylindrales bacterium]|nr:hypothetical protein [Candidatus Limnocylindrales bacterium]